MKAFVTGSTGLLGNNLVRLLVEQGHQVKALARSREKADHLFADLNVTVVRGDMQDVSSFAPELEGCDVLFHTAAYFREYYQPGDHWKTLEEINVKGTRALLEEAQQRGIQKVIYVSSSSVIGSAASGTVGDETIPPGKEMEWNLYSKSKVLAEEAVYEFLKSHSLPVVLILPTVMFGPGDIGPTGSGLLIQNFLERKLPGIIDGGFTVVDARDVAQAMITAVQQGKSGERYIVGGRYLSMADILNTLERVSGVPAPRRFIPYFVTLVYAWFLQTIAQITQRSTLITLQSIRTSHLKRRVSSAKAMRELACTFRPFEETLRDEIAWYRAQAAS